MSKTTEPDTLVHSIQMKCEEEKKLTKTTNSIWKINKLKWNEMNKINMLQIIIIVLIK